MIRLVGALIQIGQERGRGVDAVALARAQISYRAYILDDIGLQLLFDEQTSGP